VTGTVTDGGDRRMVPVKWYPELVRRVEMTKTDTKIPDCAGYWVSGVTCDGGVNSAGEPEDACSWRRRCRLIQDHMVKIGSDPQTYKNRYGSDSLARLLARLEKGPAQARPTKKPKKPARRSKKSSPAERRERRYAPLKRLMKAFIGEMAKAADGRTIVWCEKRTAAVKAGCVYLVDRTTAAYYNVYLRRAVGRPHKLAVVRLAPINGGLDIQLADTEAPAKLPDGLRHSLWRDPPMFSVVRTMSEPEHFRWAARHVIATAKRIVEGDR
jgi:hypothetical protein